MRMTSRGMLLIAATTLGFSLNGAVAFADGKIGVAAAVKNDVQGRGSRAIAVGSEVFANERIRTGDSATAQFMFLDKTVMSLGPKADLCSTSTSIIPAGLRDRSSSMRCKARCAS